MVDPKSKHLLLVSRTAADISPARFRPQQMELDPLFCNAGAVRPGSDVKVHLVCNLDCDGILCRDTASLPGEFVESGQWDATKALVAGGVLVMDAKTAARLPERERPNTEVTVVLHPSHSCFCRISHEQGTLVAESPDKVLAWCSRKGHKDVYVIGGSDAYLAFLPHSDAIHLNILRCTLDIVPPLGYQRLPMWETLRWGPETYSIDGKTDIPVINKYFYLHSPSYHCDRDHRNTAADIGGAFDMNAVLESTLREAKESIWNDDMPVGARKQLARQYAALKQSVGQTTPQARPASINIDEEEDDKIVLELAKKVSQEEFDEQDRAASQQDIICANFDDICSRKNATNDDDDDLDDWAQSDYDSDDYGEEEEEQDGS